MGDKTASSMPYQAGKSEVEPVECVACGGRHNKEAKENLA
jgi:Zn ribbon nucleic-acid-binding protein